MVKSAFSDAQRLRVMIDYLYDGEYRTYPIITYIKANFIQWHEMTEWLYKNRMKGKKMVEFFQNASPDGGGYLNGCAKILNAVKRSKDMIKADVLR